MAPPHCSRGVSSIFLSAISLSFLWGFHGPSSRIGGGFVAPGCLRRLQDQQFDPFFAADDNGRLQPARGTASVPKLGFVGDGRSSSRSEPASPVESTAAAKRVGLSSVFRPRLVRV